MATLSYAYADGVVWLEELAPEAHPMVHDLCRLHAANVRVPLGWELRDQWSESLPQEPAASTSAPASSHAAVSAPTGTPEQSRFDLIGA